MCIKNYIGNRYGRLVVLAQKRENKRTWLYCKCDCGNKKWIRSDLLTSGNIISCGCYNRENNFKKVTDITNNRFGRLIAINPTSKKDSCNGATIWLCKCDCGNTKEVSISDLQNGFVKSCGCLGKENSKSNIQKAIKVHLDKHIIEDTNLQIITRKKPQSNNTSGVTGVRWDKSRNKWYAEITFKKKVYYLGRYVNKEDAINVRKEAEEKLFGEFLEWYNRRNNNG